MNNNAWLQLVGLSVVWGASYFFIELMLVDLEPFTAMWIRFAIGLVGLIAICIATGQSMSPIGSKAVEYAITGLLISAAPFALIAWGQQFITGSLTSILMALSPIVTMVVAHFLTTDERLTPQKIVGGAFGFASVLILMVPDLANQSLSLVGQLAVLGATLCFAFGTIYAKRLHGTAPMVNATGQVLFAVSWLTPLSLIMESPFATDTFSTTTLWASLAIGLLSTTLGFVFFYNVLRSGGASNVLMVSFLVPISASILGVVFLAEPLPMTSITAYVTVLIALLIIDGRVLKRFSAKTV